MSGQFFTFSGINPEPWAVGTASAGRRGGQIRGAMSPNQKLQVYQNALREECEEVLRTMTLRIFDGKMRLRFWFWRQIEVGHSGVSGKAVSGHVADATNLQKATEDALQGLLYINDRETRFISSEIVEQGIDVQPCIVVHVEPWAGPTLDEMTYRALQQREFEKVEPKRAKTPWD